MTNDQDPKSGEDLNESAVVNADVVGDITPLDPETEALVTSALGSLPPVEMPADVHERILAALAAEPNPYALAPAASDNVAPLPAPRTRRNGWFIGVAGVAAASVLGLVVGTSVLDGESGPTAPITAAAIPMSATTNQYKKETFTTQVAAALPKWRTAAATPDSTGEGEPIVTSTGVSASEPDTVASASASPSESASPIITRVDKRLREQVAACLSRISQRAPMHVEIASYVATPTTPAEAVAVAAVNGANESVDVYAIKVTCAENDSQVVREHVTLNTQ